jgi:hypothetical protein
MKTRASLKLSRMSVPVKIEKGRHIVSCMSAMPVFNNSLPALPTIATAIAELEAAHQHTLNGNPMHTAIRHEKETVLDNLLSQVVNYVEIIANGDEAIILAAGLQVKKKTPRPPRQFAAKAGNKEGEVILQTTRTRGAGYVWQKCSANNSNEVPLSGWEQFAVTTVSTAQFIGTKPGVKYWFRVATVTSSGQGPWSDPVSLMAS